MLRMGFFSGCAVSSRIMPSPSEDELLFGSPAYHYGQEGHKPEDDRTNSRHVLLLLLLLLYDGYFMVTSPYWTPP